MTGSPCLHCGMPFDEARFPLGRPRKDGTRHPMAYCDHCMALPWRRGGGTAAIRRAANGYFRREARPGRTYRLPGVCIDCRAAVVWDGKRWLNAPRGRGVGKAHHCGTIG